MAHILRNITNVIAASVEVKRGPSDFGADIVFEYKNEIINTVEKVAVQAKAYEGKMGYKRAVEDIENAFNVDETFTQGLIIGTALEITENFEKELDTLRSKFKKPIGLIIGTDFSKWALKYGKEFLF